MRSVLPTEVPPYFWTISAMRSRFPACSHRAERDGRVGAAEAEGVGKRRADRHAARSIGYEVEIALRVLPKQVRRRRRDLIAQGQHREDRLDGGSRAEQVAGHRFGRRDRELARVIAEATLDRQAFGEI